MPMIRRSLLLLAVLLPLATRAADAPPAGPGDRVRL